MPVSSFERRRWLRDIKNRHVREAILKVDREQFVLPEHRRIAGEDHPLSIGWEQTISQPSLVAAMTEWLGVEPGHKILEIGTGSGFQTAILAEIAEAVYSIEIIPELHRQAQDNLERAGYTNIHLRAGDGYWGWPEHCPYDRILLTAAIEAIPEGLKTQCKPGGKILAPVGKPYGLQQLLLLEHQPDGSWKGGGMCPVRFVPFTRREKEFEDKFKPGR
jgi:protein-L-isoaspartate(D-aspartate) O-methyltransferase